LHKILSLYRNELDKIFHRLTTWLLLGAMVLGTFAMGGLMRAVTALVESRMGMTSQYYDADGNLVDEAVEHRRMLEEAVAAERINLPLELAKYDDEGNLKDMESSYADYGSLIWRQADLAVMELCLEHDIDYYGSNFSSGMFDPTQAYDFRTEITTVMQPIAQQLYSLEFAARTGELTPGDQATLFLARRMMQLCEEALTDGDYSDWLDLQITSLPILYGNDAEGQETMRKQYEMLKQANPEGKTNPLLILPTIQEIGRLERSLQDDVEYSDQSGGNGVPLTDAKRTDLQNQLVVANYRLEQGYFSVGQTLAAAIGVSIGGYTVMKQTGAALLAVFVLILAGSTVAQEISTGSIKALIIAPVRRRKILTAKIAAIATTALGGSLLLLLTLLGADALLFRDEFSQPYIYATHGQAHALPFAAYRAAEIAVDFLPLLCWLLFALMLSTLLRHTAAAVGVSLGGYFLGNTLGQILQLLPQSWAMRFLPMQHFNLSGAVFHFAPSGDVQGLSSAVTGIASSTASAAFSACYLAVLVLCFGWTAYDSFCRKDLK
jgi:ABC-type transport system involved in multi-copper enzyme maturation permease subunit